jgi:flagellar export protein FliJ
MSHVHDPGLRAVARVRDVRERDSRIGLQQALRTTAQREAEAAAAQRRLDSAPAFTSGTSAQFHAARASLAAMAAQARRNREAAEASRATTEEARRRWQSDRTRLRAVESLLDRRSEARRAEATRKENTELDDIAARLWLRQRRHVSPDSGGAA